MDIDTLPVFKSVDAVSDALEEPSASRFSDRISRSIDEDKAPEDAAPPATKRWGSKPSIANQAGRMPDTVRLGIRCTAVLCLSKPEDLDKFNAIQASASQQNPTAAIFDDKKDFYEGAYHCCLTYADIEYEQLI